MTAAAPRRLLKPLLVGLLGAYLAVHVAVFMLQDRLLFMPSSEVAATPAAAQLSFEPFTVTSTDDVEISGWLIPAPNARGVVLYHHGNGGNIGGRVDRARRLHDQGLTVVMFDYRGYGDSTGQPSERGLIDDSRAVYDWLVRERSVSPARIVLWGRSLGGAVAVATAEQVPCAGLVIESSFTSIAEMARRQYPWLVAATWLIRHPFRSIDRIERVEAPVLVAHGRDDELIPFTHGQRLHARSRSSRPLVELRGGHNAVGLTDPRHREPAVDPFLLEVLP